MKRYNTPFNSWDMEIQRSTTGTQVTCRESLRFQFEVSDILLTRWLHCPTCGGNILFKHLLPFSFPCHPFLGQHLPSVPSKSIILLHGTILPSLKCTVFLITLAFLVNILSHLAVTSQVTH